MTDDSRDFRGFCALKALEMGDFFGRPKIKVLDGEWGINKA